MHPNATPIRMYWIRQINNILCLFLIPFASEDTPKMPLFDVIKNNGLTPYGSLAMYTFFDFESIRQNAYSASNCLNVSWIPNVP